MFAMASISEGARDTVGIDPRDHVIENDDVVRTAAQLRFHQCRVVDRVHLELVLREGRLDQAADR